MGMYGQLLSQSCLLSEQVARQVFDILPDNGPIMAIVDRDGNYWPSDSERFTNLNISESFLKELCAKIDDGTDPVTTRVDDYSIVATQLTTEQTHCGYVLIAMPQSGPGSMPANIDLVEILLDQTGLVAKLIEKNNNLYELQLKRIATYNKREAGSN